MPLEEVPCSSPRPNSQRAHNTVCSLENYLLNFHRFLGPNFASVRAAAFCGWIASGDAHDHVVFPSRLQARIVAIVSKGLASRYIGAYPLDQAYRAAVTRRLRTMGIRDKPIAPGSP